MRIAILRVLGGVFFVLAGIFVFYNIGFGVAAPLVLVVAGAAVLLAVIAGHRTTGGDVALFVIGLLVLTAVTTSMASPVGHETTFSALKGSVRPHVVDLVAAAKVGSIHVAFSKNNDDNLAYRVSFQPNLVFPSFGSAGLSKDRLTNSSAGGVFLLNATSSLSSIVITLGTGFLVNLNLTSGAGSIDLETAMNDQVGGVYLDTGAGSVEAAVDSNEITGIQIRSGAGSVDFHSGSLGTAGTGVPIIISTGAGSVSADIVFTRNVGVSLTASAGFGTLSHSLQGFTYTHSSENSLAATAGDPAGPSFGVSVSAGTGTANIQARAGP